MPSTSPSGVGMHTESHALRHRLVEAAHRAPAIRILEQLAEQVRVVAEHQPALAQVRDRPRAVLVVADLVGVDEDRVERPVRDQRGQHVDAGADDDRHAVGEPRRREVGAREVGVTRLVLDRPQVAAVADRARDVDRGVADERADLDRPLHAAEPAQEPEQRALARSDLDRGHALGHREGARERGVLRRVGSIDVVEDLRRRVARAGARGGVGHARNSAMVVGPCPA